MKRLALKERVWASNENLPCEGWGQAGSKLYGVRTGLAMGAEQPRPSPSAGRSRVQLPLPHAATLCLLFFTGCLARARVVRRLPNTLFYTLEEALDEK